jgi:hypothetical protein
MDRPPDLPAKVRVPNEEIPMSMTTMIQDRPFWMLNREASLNWLAFGLLLAAWNAAGDDAGNARARPDALRGYSSVSVRAAQRSIAQSP